MFRPEPIDLPPDDAVDESGTHETHLLELLAVCEEFLRTASSTVHSELAEFLTAHGYHPVAGPPAFLDALMFTVTRPTDQGGAS